MKPQHPPLLGPAIARTCTRWLDGRPCGDPAVRHVIWDAEMENGFVCEEHQAELGAVWSYCWRHPVGADCGMPGSLFIIAENVCRCPDELVAAPDDVREAVAA